MTVLDDLNMFMAGGTHLSGLTWQNSVWLTVKLIAGPTCHHQHSSLSGPFLSQAFHRTLYTLELEMKTMTGGDNLACAMRWSSHREATIEGQRGGVSRRARRPGCSRWCGRDHTGCPRRGRGDIVPADHPAVARTRQAQLRDMGGADDVDAASLAFFGRHRLDRSLAL